MTMMRFVTWVLDSIKLLQKSLVPLAAQVELVHYMSAYMVAELCFPGVQSVEWLGIIFTVWKLGPPVLGSAEAQFAKALKDDDSLFVEKSRTSLLTKCEKQVMGQCLWRDRIAFLRESDNNGVLEQPCAALTLGWRKACGLWPAFLIKKMDLLGGRQGQLHLQSVWGSFYQRGQSFSATKEYLRPVWAFQAPHVLMWWYHFSFREISLVGQEKNVTGVCFVYSKRLNIDLGVRWSRCLLAWRESVHGPSK